LSVAIEWLAIDAAKQIGLDIAGIDLLIGKDSYKICEVNSSPGFEGFEMSTGVDVAKNIIEFMLVRCGVWSRKHKKKNIVQGIEIMAEHVLPEEEKKEEKVESETNKNP
jgi:hypothetical protein